MPIDAKDFNSHAEEVLEKIDPKERAIRSVISRKYYYAYHYLKDNFNWQEVLNESSFSHRRAQRFLDRIDQEDLSQTLGDLHGRRTKADYQKYRHISIDKLEEFEEVFDGFMEEIMDLAN